MQTTVTDPILFWAIRLDTSHSILLFPLPVAFLLDTSHLLYLFFCVATPSDSSHNPDLGGKRQNYVDRLVLRFLFGIKVESCRAFANEV
ncbi:hypothetical protein Y032_0031g2241 [Ancylostoma ceylanicum]|nr:hypothetical protein Y032_0031g2241 [Ancylostoma ceylanicum]